jgi:hypothetical protein
LARALEARIARLEAPHGDLTRTAARTYPMLLAYYQVLCRLDGTPMLSDAELWAMAQAEAATGRPADFTAALQAAWESEP